MCPARLDFEERLLNSFSVAMLVPLATVQPADICSSSITSLLDRTSSYSTDVHSPLYAIPAADTPLIDPVKHGIMDDVTAENIFDMVVIRLNPFINLFDV